MPALPSPGKVLRVSFRIGDGASLQAGSRFYLSYTGGPPNVTDLNTLATAVSTAWSDHLHGQTNINESLQGVTVEDLSSDTGAVGEWTGSINGVTSGAQFPAGVCCVIGHHIVRRYRGGQPRIYLRAGDSGQLTGTNELSAGFRSTLLGGWEAFVAEILSIATISITITNIVNVSWYSGYETSTPPWRGPGFKYPPKLRDTPLVDAIVSSVVATKLGSQRRRLAL